MIQTVTKWFMTTITMITAFGVFMHDGHLDKAVATRYETLLDGVQIGRNGHAHADYNAAGNLLTNSFTYQSPAIPPKNRNERKHRLEILEDFTRHAFDDVFLPLIA